MAFYIILYFANGAAKPVKTFRTNIYMPWKPSLYIMKDTKTLRNASVYTEKYLCVDRAPKKCTEN